MSAFNKEVQQVVPNKELLAEKVENQELTERQLERERYWARRARYWEAYYDENGRSIFDDDENPSEQIGEVDDEEDKQYSGLQLCCWDRHPHRIYSNITLNDCTDTSPAEEQEEEEEEEDDYDRYDYHDDDGWEDEPYDNENSITPYELARLPPDMRAAFDPEYQSGLANFRAAAREM